MFFKKKNNENEICRFCVNAKIGDDDAVTCSIRGEVEPTFSCKRFSYDLLKREPGKIRKLEPMEYIDINN